MCHRWRWRKILQAFIGSAAREKVGVCHRRRWHTLCTRKDRAEVCREHETYLLCVPSSPMAHTSVRAEGRRGTSAHSPLKNWTAIGTDGTRGKRFRNFLVFYALLHPTFPSPAPIVSPYPQTILRWPPRLEHWGARFLGGDKGGDHYGNSAHKRQFFSTLA